MLSGVYFVFIPSKAVYSARIDLFLEFLIFVEYKYSLASYCSFVFSCTYKTASLKVASLTS